MHFEEWRNLTATRQFIAELRARFHLEDAWFVAERAEMWWRLKGQRDVLDAIEGIMVDADREE
jgi:hypothetical protein